MYSARRSAAAIKGWETRRRNNAIREHAKVRAWSSEYLRQYTAADALVGIFDPTYGITLHV